MVDATIEQNNNKETDDSKRVFMLYTENDERPELKTFEWNAESKELIIRFIFDIPADKRTMLMITMQKFVNILLVYLN